MLVTRIQSGRQRLRLRLPALAQARPRPPPLGRRSVLRGVGAALAGGAALGNPHAASALIGGAYVSQAEMAARGLVGLDQPGLAHRLVGQLNERRVLWVVVSLERVVGRLVVAAVNILFTFYML